MTTSTDDKPMTHKPCPFCGNEPIVRGDRVQCDAHTFPLNFDDWDDRAFAFPPTAPQLPDMTESGWTAEQALRFYSEGRHFDVHEGRTRILDTGSVASDALKGMSPEYANMKGLSEPSARGTLYEAIWKYCRVVFYHPTNTLDYPIEHSPHANKNGRLMIEAGLSKLFDLSAPTEEAPPHLSALKRVRAMIRGNQIEHAIVDIQEPDVGLGAWLDRLLDMNKEKSDD